MWRGLGAALVAAPVAVLAVVLSENSMATAAWGSALFLLLAAYWWRGEAAGKAALPGLAAGLPAFCCAITGDLLGHQCVDGVCVSWCTPLCAAGGALSGFLLVRIARTQRLPMAAVALAAVPVLLMGVMGCSCGGYGGLAAMGGAFGALALPGLLLLLRK